MAGEKAPKPGGPKKKVGMHIEVGGIEVFYDEKTGLPRSKKFPGGGMQYFDENGVLAYTEFPNGSIKIFDVNKKLIQHLDPDGKEIPID